MFIAATASARRHKILRNLGVDFEVFATNCEEVHDDADAIGTVAANAAAKHREAAARFPGAWILAADTVVEFEGRCIGKPENMDDARRMLASFSGKRQTVFTAVAMSVGGDAARPAAAALRIAASSVMFKRYDVATVEKYLAEADVLDRAGSYDIDTMGDVVVAGWTGSFTNIMGLPEEEVGDWLKASGYFNVENPGKNKK